MLRYLSPLRAFAIQPVEYFDIGDLPAEVEHGEAIGAAGQDPGRRRRGEQKPLSAATPTSLTMT